MQAIEECPIYTSDVLDIELEEIEELENELYQ